MTTIQVLTKARALIVRGWTKYAFARDKHGHRVGPLAKTACRWCADGSLRAASGGIEAPVYKRALAALSGVMGGVAPTVNDAAETTKKDIVNAFDRAIAKAKS